METDTQGRAPKLSVFIPGKPTAWARARVSRNGGFFTPPKQRAYRSTIQRHLWNTKHPGFQKRPVEVCLFLYLPKAKSNRDLYPMGRNTSDLDNWAKIFLDAMNGVVFHDDSQVVNLSIRKRWAETALDVGAHVLVSEYF